MRHTFRVEADAGVCNALRRALLGDLENWAPCKITVRENTSCQTDEYLAHRIGMMPFRRVGNGDTMELKKRGGTAFARDMVGVAFDPVQPDIPIMDLGSDSILDLTVHFDRATPARHARYSTCAAVGMRRRDDGSHDISFELHDDTIDANTVFLRAVEALDARVDDCLVQMGRQPEVPPKSRCG